MTQPPAGSSLLFGALADSGHIKQRKNGSYRMVLKGVDEIDWFTDRPFRSEGLWKPQKLIRQWDSFFETSDPNAQASFKVGEERDLITFEMFKPKYNNKEQRLSFKIDAEIINSRENDIVTGLKSKDLEEVTLFIDDAAVAQNAIVAYGYSSVIQRILGDMLEDVSSSALGLVSVFELEDLSNTLNAGNVNGALVEASNQLEIAKSVIEISGSTPVLATTASITGDTIVELIGAGACNILGEPFTPEVFKEKLTSCGML